MCGIAGVITSWPNKSLHDTVSTMLNLISHRGPDQRGVSVLNDRAALGMNRLSIVDHEKHSIPYFNEDGSLVLVFNGEIFNFREIRANLRERHEFKSDSDTEIILHAFEEKGIDCINDFNGMFALALYDLKNKRLYMVRDRIGKKNLYFSLYQGAFYFSSEIRSILECVPASVNWRCMPYQAFEFCCDAETMFKGIYSMQPGEYLVYENGRVTQHNYWKIWDNLIDVPDDEKRIERQLAELIEDSINLRYQGLDHRYCCFVSGGVDSSLLAAIARPDVLYTAHYPLGKAFDELKYARMLADYLKIPMKIIRPTPEEFSDTREKIISILEQPATWTSFTLYRLVEEACRDNRVILAGEGPDELFAGYTRYLLLYNDQRIHNLEAMREYNYLINKYYGRPEERYARLINRQEGLDPELRDYLDSVVSYYFSKTDDVIHAMGITDFYTTMQVLLQMSDKICMAFSTENRHPFLDHRLVQYAFSMPSKYKIKNGVTKYIFKEAAKKFIPAEIADRVDKRGFSAPVNVWFKWTEDGNYDRNVYRDMIYSDWLKVFFGRQRGPEAIKQTVVQ